MICKEPVSPAPPEDLCVIEPKKSKREEALPPLAILVFSPDDLGLFSACFSQPLRRSHKLYLSDVFTGSYEGTPVAIAGPMLGAPQSVLVLEKMIALGARKFIAAGWCGSLHNEVQIGDIVLPSGAISEEGTSGHYPGATFTPSSSIVEYLRSALAPTGVKIHEGTVWTTDAPFRETYAKLKAFQSQGVLCVEMEASALFTVSRFRGADLAVVLVVSDNLSGLKWVHGFRDPAFRESRRKLIQSTLRAIRMAACAPGA
jgi:uridine phosphorylase